MLAVVYLIICRIDGRVCGKLQSFISLALSTHSDLLMDLRLIMFSMMHAMLLLLEYVPMTFLPDAMVKEHGVPRLDAGHIVAFFGISNTVGAILSGLCTNYLMNSVMVLNLICMLVLGTCCIGMAFSSLYWHFVVCFFIYGIFLRHIKVLIPISLVEMFGVESLMVSFSVIMACSGIASLIGPPMLGWFKELQGTYDFAFTVAGGLYFLGGIPAFVLLGLQRRRNNFTGRRLSEVKK